MMYSLKAIFYEYFSTTIHPIDNTDNQQCQLDYFTICMSLKTFSHMKHPSKY